jgi:hypothetical protein
VEWGGCCRGKIMGQCKLSAIYPNKKLLKKLKDKLLYTV